MTRRWIIKLEGGIDGAPEGGPWYMVWSPVVDAPLSRGMPLPEFRQWYMDAGMGDHPGDLEDRLARVEEFGTSSLGGPSNVFAVNAAGPNGERLTYAQIVEQYCIGDGGGRVPP